MSPGLLWTIVVVVNAVGYVAFIRARGEGGLLLTTALALVLGRSTCVKRS